jgi:hypothetical protein
MARGADATREADYASEPAPVVRPTTTLGLS